MGMFVDLTCPLSIIPDKREKIEPTFQRRLIMMAIEKDQSEKKPSNCKENYERMSITTTIMFSHSLYFFPPTNISLFNEIIFEDSFQPFFSRLSNQLYTPLFFLFRISLFLLLSIKGTRLIHQTC